jgi:hypothetical protein
MQWSKAKARVEQLFAPSVAGRVELRTANYRKAPDMEGRGWITVEGAEVYNFCTHRYLLDRHMIESGIREANDATNWRDPEQSDAYYAAGDDTQQILERRGVVSQGFFEQSIEAYPTLSIDDALQSSNFIHRALAMVDRRLGKRRLKSLTFRTDEHPLVWKLYEYRCASEGIEPARQRTSSVTG